MQPHLMLTLYRNVKGAVIGELYAVEDNKDSTILLATTHPATLAAAVFAMDAAAFTFKSPLGIQSFSFPMALEELSGLEKLLVDADEGVFMSGFASFSQVDFARPDAAATRADLHYRVAVHYLPAKLVQHRPSAPEPADFARELRNRNPYIYYPWVE